MKTSRRRVLQLRPPRRSGCATAAGMAEMPRLPMATDEKWTSFVHWRSQCPDPLQRVVSRSHPQFRSGKQVWTTLLIG
jgi:hypothetical protein